MPLRDVGKGESKLKKLIPTVASYFRKAAFNATGDQVKAEKVGQLIESQLSNMPDDVAKRYEGVQEHDFPRPAHVWDRLYRA